MRVAVSATLSTATRRTSPTTVTAVTRLETVMVDVFAAISIVSVWSTVSKERTSPAVMQGVRMTAPSLTVSSRGATTSGTAMKAPPPLLVTVTELVSAEKTIPESETLVSAVSKSRASFRTPRTGSLK